MKVTGMMIIEKEKALRCIRTVIHTRVIFIEAKLTAKVNTHGPMVRTMLVIGNTVKNMAKGGGKLPTETLMSVNGKWAKPMVVAHTCGLTVTSTRVSGRTFSSMEKGQMYLLLVTFTLVITCEVGQTAGVSTHGPMAQDTWASSRMVSNMDKDTG